MLSSAVAAANVRRKNKIESAVSVYVCLGAEQTTRSRAIATRARWVIHVTAAARWLAV